MKSVRTRVSWLPASQLLVSGLMLALALLAGCTPHSVRQNYTGFKADEEIGTFVQSGYRFRLSGDMNEAVDRLNLAPGSYLIEFVDTFTGMHGAALCEVKAGMRYEIYPSGFRDFPKAMKRVLIGTCYPTPVSKK